MKLRKTVKHYLLAFSISLFLLPHISAQCLNGTYTVGGTNADFAGLDFVMQALDNDSLCGPVVFNIRPGNYNSFYTLDTIAGSSPVNSVTFRAENGDSSSVILTRSTTNFDWAFKLNRTKNVHFEKLSFEIYQPNVPRTWAQIFHLTQAENISIKNCRISNRRGRTLQNATHSIYIFYSKDIVIENNYFDNGIRGVSASASRNRRNENFLIKNNVFDGFDFAVSIADANNVSVEENVYESSRSSNLNLSRCNDTKVVKNYFEQRVFFSDVYTSNPAESNLIANNICKGFAISFVNSSSFKVVYNTLYEHSLTFYQTDTVEILNNIFIMSGLNPFVSGRGDISSKNFRVDYNGYENPDGFNYKLGDSIPNFTDLTAFQQATGWDTHSFLDTFYLVSRVSSRTDPHLDTTNFDNLAVTNKGLPLPYITHDIDGEPRNPVNPDMGADEIMIQTPSYDLAVVGTTLPDTVCPGSHTMHVSIENLSPEDIDRYRIFIAQDGEMLDSITVLGTRWLIDSVMLPARSTTDSVFRRKVFVHPDSTTDIQIWVEGGNDYIDTLRNNDTLSFQLHAWSKVPDPQLPRELSLSQNGEDTIRLSPTSGFATYQWTTGETTPEISISHSGVYGLEVSDPKGCKNYGSVFAQVEYLEDGLWLTDTPDRSVSNTPYVLAGDGDRLLVGGEFDYVGPYQPYLGRYDLKQDRVEEFPSLKNFDPSTQGTFGLNIYDVEPDGKGGWYVGGNFSQVGTAARHNLAHIDAQGELLPLNINIDGPVNDLMLMGDRLYIGGKFNHVQGRPQVGVAVLDLKTELVLNWDAHFIYADIQKMVVYGDTLFLAGRSTYRLATTSAGYYYNHKVVATDLSTGQILPNEDWKWLYDNFDANINGPPAKNILLEGEYLVIDVLGGYIIHLPTRQFVLGGPNTDNFSFVSAKDGHLYYQTGLVLKRMDLLTQTTVDLISFEQAKVRSIAFTDTSFWMGGQYTLSGDTTVRHLAEFDLATGTFNGHEIHIFHNKSARYGDSFETVNKLSLLDDQLIVGGSFISMGALPRSNLYEFDLATRRPTDWNPDPNDEIFALEANEGRIYVGGDFTQIQGQSQKSFAVFDSARQLISNLSYPFSGPVYDFAFTDSSVYIAGSFDHIGQYNNQHAMAINKSTGSILPFGPTPNLQVEDIEVIDTTVFMVGGFYQFEDSTSRWDVFDCGSGFAYVNAITGRPRWCARDRFLSPDHFSQIEKYNDELYIGGYTWVSSAERTPLFLKANSYSLGFDTVFSVITDQYIKNFQFSCDKLYLFGDFTEVNNNPEYKFAVLDMPGNQVYDFFNNPDSAVVENNILTLSGRTDAMLVHKGKLYKHLTYTNLKDFTSRRGLVEVDLGDLSALSNGNRSLDFTSQKNNLEVQFQNISTSTGPDFIWDFGDGNRTRTFSPTHTYRQSGNYTVKLIASDDCSADTVSQQIQVGNVGIEELRDAGIKIYPNPSQGELTVEINAEQSSMYKLRIMDAAGRTYKAEQIRFAQGSQKVKLDLSSLPAGMYFLMLHDGKTPYTQKFILMN